MTRSNRIVRGMAFAAAAVCTCVLALACGNDALRVRAAGTGAVSPAAHAASPRPVVPMRIALQPFVGFNRRLTDSVRHAVGTIFGTQAVVLESVELPHSAFVNIKTPRYRADSLLQWLRARKPADVDCIMGLTASDISTTKREPDGSVKKPAARYLDFGIFGLGNLGGPASVISTFRLVDRNNRARLVDRLQKVCVHELGHNAGLPHCSDTMCVMSDAAETIRTVDNSGIELCPRCKARLAGR